MSSILVTSKLASCYTIEISKQVAYAIKIQKFLSGTRRDALPSYMPHEPLALKIKVKMKDNWRFQEHVVLEVHHYTRNKWKQRDIHDRWKVHCREVESL